eukprot:3496810-Prymnesium_polylepis.1
MQNISDDILHGGAEPHDLTDDAGDRAGSLVDNVLRAGGDNIVAVQNKIFHPANLKLLYREDSQTLERLKSSVPDFVQYTSRLRSQTRDVIAKHPNFAGIVDVYN